MPSNENELDEIMEYLKRTYRISEHVPGNVMQVAGLDRGRGQHFADEAGAYMQHLTTYWYIGCFIQASSRFY